MKLRDFAIIAAVGFTDPVAINRRCAPIVEAVRMEFAKRPRIEAPFSKLVVQLYNEETGAPKAWFRSRGSSLTLLNDPHQAYCSSSRAKSAQCESKTVKLV